MEEKVSWSHAKVISFAIDHLYRHHVLCSAKGKNKLATEQHKKESKSGTFGKEGKGNQQLGTSVIGVTPIWKF